MSPAEKRGEMRVIVVDDDGREGLRVPLISDAGIVGWVAPTRVEISTLTPDEAQAILERIAT